MSSDTTFYAYSPLIKIF